MWQDFWAMVIYSHEVSVKQSVSISSIYLTSTIATWIIKQSNSIQVQSRLVMDSNIRLSMCGVVQERSFRIWFEISYFFSNLELCPIMSLFRGHTWRNILYRGHWKLIFQSWNESQKKKVFVRKTHVEEATTSINFVSRSSEINFPILKWITKKEGLCSEGTCGGSIDL